MQHRQDTACDTETIPLHALSISIILILPSSFKLSSPFLCSVEDSSSPLLCSSHLFPVPEMCSQDLSVVELTHHIAMSTFKLMVLLPPAPEG